MFKYCVFFFLFFFSTAVSAANVSFAVQETSENILLNVFVNDTETPLFGAAFDVIFDNELLEYIGYEPGTFFDNVSDIVHLVHLRDGSRLVTGITQRISQYSIEQYRDKPLISYRFKKRAAGPLQFRFEHGVLARLDNEVRENIVGVVWHDYDVDHELEGNAFMPATPALHDELLFGIGTFIFVSMTVIAVFFVQRSLHHKRSTLQ